MPLYREEFQSISEIDWFEGISCNFSEIIDKTLLLLKQNHVKWK